MHSYRNGLKERHVIRIQSLLPKYMTTFIYYFSYPKEENRKWTEPRHLHLWAKQLVTISWKTVVSLRSQCKDIFNWKTKQKQKLAVFREKNKAIWRGTMLPLNNVTFIILVLSIKTEKSATPGKVNSKVNLLVAK